jgi:hypothetical protein
MGMGLVGIRNEISWMVIYSTSFQLHSMMYIPI